MPDPIGPFETETEVADVPAVRAIYAAMRASTRRGVMATRGHQLLLEACASAGVELGAYDHQILQWLAGFMPESSAVIAGIISRAGSKRTGPVQAERAALLGKRVRVTLDENVVHEGRLLGFGDGGDFEIDQDDGFVYHAWPLLAIEEIPDA
jgi:hypothetical protein